MLSKENPFLFTEMDYTSGIGSTLKITAKRCVLCWKKARLEKPTISEEGAKKTNIEVVTMICDILEDLLPLVKNTFLKENSPSLKSYRDLITFVPDRPGHDRRYGLDTSKIERVLGWRPDESFESGIRKTIKWYLDNLEWCEKVTKGKYDRRRLGLISV